MNPFRDFFLLKSVSILKRPYLISLGRYLELISCVNLATLVYLFLKDKTKQQISVYIKYIFNFCLLFALLNTIIFALLKFNFIDESNHLYYDHGIRLKGWYVEGGPYGLMVSFTFILTFFYKNKYHILSRFFLVFVVFFLARSKAGIILIITWYILIYYKIAYYKLRELNIVVIIIGGLLVSLVIVKLGDGYINDIVNVKREMKERPRDVNLVMGRIAGLFIFPKMVSENPVFGIGLGNYPIMRNNPQYLGFIPRSPTGKTDAHGYGGLVQLLVDGGLVILILFLFIIYKLFIKLKNRGEDDEKYLLIFLFFFVFGVQIYFLYPWILLGVLMSLSIKKV
ncbi:hypothetical protein [Polaribacter sp. ALD11]|uniref:hypothetical protein n=1 Tax=Polaribacter sp. ALD11 TaxID=2058137 RepID=UPI0012FDEDFF|nr:hypothetical protein [Polaribacter sp. ALD11]